MLDEGKEISTMDSDTHLHPPNGHNRTNKISNFQWNKINDQNNSSFESCDTRNRSRVHEISSQDQGRYRDKEEGRGESIDTITLEVTDQGGHVIYDNKQMTGANRPGPNLNLKSTYSKPYAGKDTTSSGSPRRDVNVSNSYISVQEEDYDRLRESGMDDFSTSQANSEGYFEIVNAKTNKYHRIRIISPPPKLSSPHYHGKQSITSYGVGRIPEPKKTKRSYIIVLPLLLIVLVAVGIGALIYFLPKHKPCNKISHVENGNVSMSDSSNTIVECEEGYGHAVARVTMTCSNGQWSKPIPCPIIDCGQYPTVDNGHVNGSNTTFDSVAQVKCMPGFMLNGTSTITCTKYGNWNSGTQPGCVPHPCGPYNLSEYVQVLVDFSHINMTMSTTCESGFSFTNESDTYLLCVNNTWTNNPTCEVAGNLSLITKNDSTLMSGRQFIFSCNLDSLPYWGTIYLSRKLQSSKVDTPLLVVTHTGSGTDVVVEHYDESAEFEENVTVSADGVVITAAFQQVSCKDTGLYSCVLLVGTLGDSRGNKTTSKQFKVIDRSFQIEEFQARNVLSQGEQVFIRCRGKLGMDQNGDKIASLSIKIIYGSESHAETLPSKVESSFIKDCQVTEVINATIMVTNDMNKAELMCVIETNDGSTDRRSKLLDVSTTKVNINIVPTMLYIGDDFTVSTDLINIRGWEAMEIRRVCSQSNEVIASIEKVVLSDVNETIVNETVSSWSLDDHVTFIEEYNDTLARLTVAFNESRCSDACKEGGRVNYTSAVKLIDGWVEKYTDVDFQVKPTLPVLTSEPMTFYRDQEATIKCVGNVGIPAEKMTIKPESAEVNWLLATNEADFNTDTCVNITTVTQSFIVRNDHIGVELSCEVNTDDETFVSNKLVIEVAEPVLYFTEESKEGEIGRSKSMRCVASTISTLTTVEIRKHSSKDDFSCTVTIYNDTVTPSCSMSDWSVNWRFSDNGTLFFADIVLPSVTCDSGGVYICETNTDKTQIDFMITGTSTIPSIRIPKTLVKDQSLLWEDVLSCTADLGYPRDNKELKLQYRPKGSDTFEDWLMATPQTAQGCKQNLTITYQGETLDSNMNDSTLRCIIDNKGMVEQTSALHELKILENICLNSGTGEYDPHPYNCHKFIRCVGKTLYVFDCATGSCATSDSDQICSTLDCSNCPN